jgi:hypothetical protein
MGTRGYYVFKYNGIYYIFYNHYDSYFDGLGQKIVDDINELIQNTKDWVEILKNLVSEIPLCEDADKDASIHFTNIINCLEYPLSFEYYTSKKAPSNNAFSEYIEYIYTIDLDSMKFIVKPVDNEYYNIKVFPLNKIPKNWKQFCTIDVDETEETEETEETIKTPEDKYDKMMDMMQNMMKKIENLENLIKK